MITTKVTPFEASPDSAAGVPIIEFSIFDLIIGILKRRRAILLITVVAATLSLLLAFIMPVSYTSTTKLMPPQQNQSIASSVLGQLGPLAGLAGKDLSSRNSSELYVALLQSDTVE